MTPCVENVLHWYLRASDANVDFGLQWYSIANATARSIDALRFHRAAGVIAALSPMNKWDNNVNKARLLYANNGVVNWDGSANGYGLGKNVEKAVAIYNGNDALDVLGGDKVRAFFATIVDPDGDHEPVIDRHAFDVAINQRTNDAAKRVLKRKGEYARFSDIYRDAASLAGIGPSQLQAITWVAWREAHGIYDD
jgi:hypothetical protein